MINVESATAFTNKNHGINLSMNAARMGMKRIIQKFDDGAVAEPRYAGTAAAAAAGRVDLRLIWRLILYKDSLLA
jgi:hypothetical protein